MNLEAGKRREVVEAIKGFLKLRRISSFDQLIHLLLHPGVTIVIIDLRQRIDDFGAGRPRQPTTVERALWSIEIRVFLEILDRDEGFPETKSMTRREEQIECVRNWDCEGIFILENFSFKVTRLWDCDEEDSFSKHI